MGLLLICHGGKWEVSSCKKIELAVMKMVDFSCKGIVTHLKNLPFHSLSMPRGCEMR